MGHVAFALLLAATLAYEPAAAMGHQHDAKPRQAKPALAVGAALDSRGRVWLATMENQLLWVSRSDDGGQQFSRPVAVSSEPESIAADGENRPKIAVARDGTVLLSWTQSLPQNYSGNVRFARSTEVAAVLRWFARTMAAFGLRNSVTESRKYVGCCH